MKLSSLLLLTVIVIFKNFQWVVVLLVIAWMLL